MSCSTAQEPSLGGSANRWITIAPANDAGIYTEQVQESWINPALNGIAFGRPERPFLGPNGPADNIRSSCLSCHAAARTPRSARRLLGSSFDLDDLGDSAKVKAHVDIWFQNSAAGEVFDQGNPNAAAALDYSPQLESAFFRMCSACEDGAMSGNTPAICIAAEFFTEQTCTPMSLMSVVINQERRSELPLPRQ